MYDITNYLNRAPFEPNDAMRLGSEYEKQVQKLTQGGKVTGQILPTAKDMAALVADGVWQVTVKTYITIEEQRYVIWGKIDVLRPDGILDIKTTQEYKGEDKYLGTTQHIMYLHAAHQSGWKHSKFKYLVSDFHEIHQIEFEVGDWDLLAVEAHRIIQAFLEFLKQNPKLQKAYETKFCR